METYIMAIDQGTTSCRAVLINHAAEVIASAQKEFTQYFPHPGWVEHDANEIYLTVQSVMATCLQKAKADPQQIVGIGITNQRETTVVWDKESGLPIYNAIVWQSRQTSEICDQLRAQGCEELIQSHTGLRIDPYFSATKIRWILDHVDGAQERAEKGELLAGTIDTWLIWKLSDKAAHVTDYTNASRTMLYNIYDRCWDPEILKLLQIPESMLPQVQDCSGLFATVPAFHFYGHAVPILGVAGDQQAALFGQKCFHPGMAKNTYGTGCFLLMNTGETPQRSKNGLVTTIACGYEGKITYALEGSIFVAGSAIQWLRDQMHFMSSSAESEDMAKASGDHSVMVVPAFTGLGAPYWDPHCRGAIFGITRGTTPEDLTRATLNSLAYQTRDVLTAMEKDAGRKIAALRVDGGASANRYLMQFQSDLLQCQVVRPQNVESTALGAAFLAGLSCGYWENLQEIEAMNSGDHTYEPAISKEEADALYTRWQQAVRAARMMPYAE